MSYVYVGPAMLEKPFHYMYTPFEGSAFVEAWRRERERFRDALRLARGDDREDEMFAAMTRRQSARGALDARAFSVWPRRPGETAFETRELLLDLCSVALAGTDSDARDAWMRAMIKRFEIAKRLHPRYDERMRPLGDASLTPDLYALLAVLVAADYASSGDVRKLNTLLKLIDLLASFESLPADPICTAAALSALEIEMSGVSALLRRHALSAAC